MPRRIGIDNEGAIESLVDMPFQRRGMTVIQMAAERKSVEFVDEILSWPDFARARNAVHPSRMDAMEMHGVNVATGVAENDADSVALGDTQGWTRDPTTVGPGREHDPRRDFDLLVLRGDNELAKRATARPRTGDTLVPV